MDNIIYENVRKTIKQSGYNLKEIAAALGINQNTLYSKLRRLQNSDKIDMDFLKSIAAVINVDLLDLAFGVDTRNTVFWFNSLLPVYQVEKINNKKYVLKNTKTKKSLYIDNEQLAFLRRQLEKMIYNYIDDFIKII